MPSWSSNFTSSAPVLGLGLIAILSCTWILLQRSRASAPNPSIQHYQWDNRAAGTAKKRWLWDSLTLLREGYFRFYNQPWQVWTSEGYQVVLPPSYVDELKMLPDHTLPSSLREFMLPQYTFKPFPSWKLDYVNHVILHDLNKNMAKVFPAMSEEVDFALSEEFPSSTDWTETDIATQALRLICRISGRAFVGSGSTDLHRNEEWIDISCRYTKDLFLAALKLRAVPFSFLRPLVAFFLPDLRRVYRHNDRARALVQPILQQRERDAKTVVVDPGYVKPNDTIQWLHDLIPDGDKKDYAYQGAAQLAITAVSVQSTSKLIVNIMLNLIEYAEYVPVLVEEIKTVQAECGGHWTLASMGRLEKLDSFMRESLRFEPPLTATFQRRAMKPVKLRDGTVLPPGTLMLAPADAIAFDRTFYPDPETFDGLRFEKLRQQAVETGEVQGKVRHQFVATSKTQVQFGLGRHACPGRWFAGHAIKLVVASVLLNYDFKFRDGEVNKTKTFLFQTTNMPHPKTRILIRKKL